MLQITSVEPQKKNPKRFNIFIDGEFAFGADEDTVVSFRLLRGKKIDNSDLEKILLETEVGRWMEKMYVLFSFRQRSEKEVRDYFYRKNFEAKLKDKDEVGNHIIDLIIDRLKSKNLINDYEFAKAWVEARQKSRNKGIQIIKTELYQKGINRDIIEEITSEHNSGSSEEELAKLALSKRVKRWKNLSQVEFIQKAVQYLMRSGFGYPVAKDVARQFLNNPDL